jgi:hypothetical protein
MYEQKQGRRWRVHNRGGHHSANHGTCMAMAWEILVTIAKCDFIPIGKPYEVDSYFQLAGTAQRSLFLGIDDGSDRGRPAIDNDVRKMGDFDVIENFEVDGVARPCVGRREVPI